MPLRRKIALGLLTLSPLTLYAAPAYQVFVTNEKSDDVTIIDGASQEVVATIPIGKRPRGIHVSPDGNIVYVAVSGTPSAGPPEPGAKGGQKKSDDDATADKTADGIAVVDVRTHAVSRKIAAGSDPEEFALSKDGSRIYISNEDTKSVTVINVATQTQEHVIPVSAEPEGVTTTPDGKFFYVACEAGGDVYVIDTTRFSTFAKFQVEGRPRSVDFVADGSVGFVPSESSGQVNIVDGVQHKVIKTLTLPEGSRPMRVKVAPDGRKVYVSNGRGGTISVIDTRSYALLDSIKVGPRPWGIAVSPDGKLLYAANGPSNDVSVVELATNKEIARIKAGTSPWGIAIVPR